MAILQLADKAAFDVTIDLNVVVQGFVLLLNLDQVIQIAFQFIVVKQTLIPVLAGDFFILDSVDHHLMQRLQYCLRNKVHEQLRVYQNVVDLVGGKNDS